MRVLESKRARWVVLAGAALLGLVALAGPVGAQLTDGSSCDSTTTTAEQVVDTADTRPLAGPGAELLPSDGRGFFGIGANRISIRTGDRLAETEWAAETVVRLLTEIDDSSEVSIEATTPADAALPDDTRVVVIDGDIAVPGSPRLFEVGGHPTLFLHWSTAADDLSNLLDEPSFSTLQGPAPQGATPPSPCPTSEVDSASPDGLAYVNEDEAGEREPVGGGTPAGGGTAGDTISSLDRLPIAESAPADRWPYSVVGAALLVTAGGVVIHRRDQLFDRSHHDERRTRFIEFDPTGELIDEPEPSRPGLDPSAFAIDLGVELGPEAFTPDTQPQEEVSAHPREIVVENLAIPDAATRRRIDLEMQLAESPLARSVGRLTGPKRDDLLTREEFADLMTDEWERHVRGGGDGAVASLVIAELDAVRLRLGANAANKLLADVAHMIRSSARLLDVVGIANENELGLLMPNTEEKSAQRRLDEVSNAIATTTFMVGEERVLLTPAAGFAMLSDTGSATDLVRAIETARGISMLTLDLGPKRWDGTTVSVGHGAAKPARQWRDALRTPMQIALTVVICWVLPFFAYTALATIGFDVSFYVYLFLVVSLLLTGAFILAEGYMALDQKEPPEPQNPYPKATALIAAYLPNEAATVVETIESFLHLDYPNDVQIILAYNTPETLPVEDHLDRLAIEHPNFVPVRIVGSNSKAQNVNAALSMAEGEFIGMFDADHQPRPDAFTRAWKWLDAGYDVVQGHCLTRNGNSSFLAKMIAVEFEAIYAVAHPGRAKMHRFGVFGGSNGFWRTSLLHETRMRGSMLTEDIDSSLRIVEKGFRIRSDRDLVSRELATTTFKQVWNQRMRWAQGWFQVSLEHAKRGIRSPELNVRQKFGLVHLLMWREIYPWLSQQLFPLLAFWAWRAGGFEKLDWTMPIFLATSIFTFSVGPIQTWFAYHLADPEIKRHKWWFWAYLVFTTPFYTEYKNLISRVAHVKQFMGESNWRVTPRSADPVDD